jgi:hypothetical protein
LVLEWWEKVGLRWETVVKSGENMVHYCAEQYLRWETLVGKRAIRTEPVQEMKRCPSVNTSIASMTREGL